MHWVDRGPEPQGLDSIRSKFTPDWVNYYKKCTGQKPEDSLWSKFRKDIKERFSDLCAYCERRCDDDIGEIDHFKPKSRFPNLVYEWSNLILACSNCNRSKDNKWPPGGYIDPCEVLLQERPEIYFEYDAATCHIIPLDGLSPAMNNRAIIMIKHLNLNGEDHINRRRSWLELLDIGLASGLYNDTAVSIRLLTSSQTPHFLFKSSMAFRKRLSHRRLTARLLP